MTSNDWVLVARDGAILSVAAGVWIMLVLRFNPRLFLRNYPHEIREVAPPNTPMERRLAVVAGLPLFALLIGVPVWSAWMLAHRHGGVTRLDLFLDAFAVGVIFNLVDWLVLDIAWLGWTQPVWAAIPGTEDVKFELNYRQHFRGFITGSVVAAIVGIIAAFIV